MDDKTVRSSQKFAENPENSKRQLLFECLKTYFRYENFTSPEQYRAISLLNEGKNDLLVCMPTGAGKSLCYQLPTMMNQLRKKLNSGRKTCIVVSPLISLLCDQITFLKNLGISVGSINSTMSKSEKNKVIIALKSNSLSFLFLTPEMLAKESFQHFIDEIHSKYNCFCFVAIDEAHCIAEWGHDFRPSYLSISKIRQYLENVPFIALTATMNSKVRSEIIANLKLGEVYPLKEIRTSTFRKNLFYEVVFKENLTNCLADLISFISNVSGPCIIYCHARDTCDYLASQLLQSGITCKSYHAGLKNSGREKVQKSWQIDNKVKVVIATISFGMGIDKQGVEAVLHWDIPKNLSSYYQESGRAGRSSNKKSFCRLYFSEEDRNRMAFIIRNQKLKNSNKIEKSLKEFELMNDYCISLKCRHFIFAKYFNDESFTSCNNMCDYCVNPSAVAEKLDKMRNNKYICNKPHTSIQSVDPDNIYQHYEEDFSIPNYDEKMEKRAKQNLHFVVASEFKRRKENLSNLPVYEKSGSNQFSNNFQLPLKENNPPQPIITKHLRDDVFKKFLKFISSENDAKNEEQGIFDLSKNSLSLYKSKVVSKILELKKRN